MILAIMFKPFAAIDFQIVWLSNLLTTCLVKVISETYCVHYFRYLQSNFNMYVRGICILGDMYFMGFLFHHASILLTSALSYPTSWFLTKTDVNCLRINICVTPHFLVFQLLFPYELLWP
jgi:hypothetical protein